jgi:hypothetical protein
MLEFIFGFLSGIVGSALFRKRLVNRSIGIQAEEVWSHTVESQPILIQNSKIKFVPKLQNFWGPDS